MYMELYNICLFVSCLFYLWKFDFMHTDLTRWLIAGVVIVDLKNKSYFISKNELVWE